MITNAVRYDPNSALIEVETTPDPGLDSQGYLEFNFYGSNLGDQNLDLLVMLYKNGTD